MKNFRYILLVAVFLTSSVGYLAAQEYDDLYFDPKKDSQKETPKVAEQATNEDRVKSDYEKYRESLENSDSLREATEKSLRIF